MIPKWTLRWCIMHGSLYGLLDLSRQQDVPTTGHCPNKLYDGVENVVADHISCHAWCFPISTWNISRVLASLIVVAWASLDSHCISSGDGSWAFGLHHVHQLYAARSLLHISWRNTVAIDIRIHGHKDILNIQYRKLNRSLLCQSQIHFPIW
jgi:hypothetical protein